jgi:Ala-tRNA(Pro) deacylase
MAVAETVKQSLESAGVDYQLVAHPRSATTRETAASAEVPADHIAKAVILRDDTGFVMAVIPGSNWIRIHKLQHELNRPLQLAPESEAERLFGDCRPGAMPCLGAAYGIETVVDEEIDSLANVYFEAGDHELLVRLSGDDFRTLLSGARRGFYSHPGED